MKYLQKFMNQIGTKLLSTALAKKNAWAWKVCCYVQKTTTFFDIPAELVEGDILKSIRLFCPEICNPKSEQNFIILLISQTHGKLNVSNQLNDQFTDIQF